MVVNCYDSPIGKILIQNKGKYLTGLYIEGQKNFNTVKELQQKNAVLEQTKTWLNIYFSGKQPDFTPPLLLESTDFRKAVWNILLTIPFGQTMTYKQIAQMIAQQRGITNMSAQAIGGAVSHNPISIIVPCHRVIGSNGSLTGYAGGIDKKEKLLSIEKNSMEKNGLSSK